MESFVFLNDFQILPVIHKNTQFFSSIFKKPTNTLSKNDYPWFFFLLGEGSLDRPGGCLASFLFLFFSIHYRSHQTCQKRSYNTLVMFRMGMTATQFDIHSVLVVNNAAYARKRCIDESLTVVECAPMFFGVGQRTWINQKAHVIDLIVTAARYVYVCILFYWTAAHIAVQAHVPITFLVLAQ